MQKHCSLQPPMHLSLFPRAGMDNSSPVTEAAHWLICSNCGGWGEEWAWEGGCLQRNSPPLPREWRVEWCMHEAGSRRGTWSVNNVIQIYVMRRGLFPYVWTLLWSGCLWVLIGEEREGWRKHARWGFHFIQCNISPTPTPTPTTHSHVSAYDSGKKVCPCF